MGRGVAKLLSQKGANIVIVARNEKNLAEAFKYISVCAYHTSGRRSYQFYCMKSDCAISLQRRTRTNNASTPYRRTLPKPQRVIALSQRLRLGTMASPQISFGRLLELPTRASSWKRLWRFSERKWMSITGAPATSPSQLSKLGLSPPPPCNKMPAQVRPKASASSS